jgi:hypothetical protein
MSHTHVADAPSPLAGPAFEPHLSVREIAEIWGLSVDSIRHLFEDEPGVLRIARAETLHKRKYCSLRIPVSVAEKVHRKLLTKIQ